jgi:hypothetical protein
MSSLSTHFSFVAIANLLLVLQIFSLQNPQNDLELWAKLNEQRGTYRAQLLSLVLEIESCENSGPA